MNRQRGADPVRGALAGALGGVLGTWAMASAGALWTSLTPVPNDPRLARERSRRLRNAGVGVGHHAQSEPRSHQRGISPSERAITIAARQRSSNPIEPRLREQLGSVLHYGFGAFAGAVYGLLAPRWPRVTMGGGLVYGTAVLLVADELVIPATGLADSPTRSPLRRHLYALVGHWAYGGMLEAVRRRFM